MDFDLNEEFGSGIFTEDVEAVIVDVNPLNAAAVGDNRASNVWDLNLDASSYVDQGVVEGQGEVDGEGEVDETIIVNSPAVGDEFDSSDDAYHHWQLYGKQTGFGVCKRTNHKKDDYIYDYHFACSKYKKPWERSVDGEPESERRRPTVGTHCKAFLKVSDYDQNGKWVVRAVNLEHNHELLPESSFLIPAFRYIPVRYQNMLEYNEDQGISPGDNIEIVLKNAGGYWKGTFTRKDARNHLDKYRRQKIKAIGGDDALLLTEYFEKKQLTDRDFFFTYKYTDEGRLWNIFWADGRGRAAYKYFHDVVVLDATYLTNR